MAQMELFHIHKCGTSDEIWFPGNEILVSPEFNNNMIYKLQKYKEVLADFYKELYPSILDYSKEELAYINSHLNPPNFVKFAFEFIKNEVNLESVRQEYYRRLPSRLHCLYACDKDAIDYWINMLGCIEYNVYKIYVDGIIFKSNEDYIPFSAEDANEAYSMSFKYWNPDLSIVPKQNCEYLINGAVKLIRKF